MLEAAVLADRRGDNRVQRYGEIRDLARHSWGPGELAFYICDVAITFFVKARFGTLQIVAATIGQEDENAAVV